MTTATDRVLAECQLRAAPWPTPPGACAWCGQVLAARRRRWCSDACSDAFTRNHNWQFARHAALERDGHACTGCGTTASGPPDLRAWWAFVLAVCPVPTRADFAGQHPEGFRAGLAAWDALYGATYGEAEALRWRDAYGWALEVNHKVPILGRHGEFGCHHHLDGVETLCHACHLAETARQFGHRPKRVQGPTLFDLAAP